MAAGGVLRLRFSAVLLVVVVSSGLPGRACAALSTVVMLRPAVGDAVSTELITRLKGELSTDRFQVVVLDHVVGADLIDEMLRAARLFQPIALFAVFADPKGGADVWLVDRVLDLPRIQHVEMSRSGPESSSVLAVRAIEILRASVLAGLLDRRSGALEPSATQCPACPEVVATADDTARPSARRFGFELGPSILGSFQGLGASVGPVLRMSYSVKRDLALRATASAFGTRPTLNGPDGQAIVDQELGFLELAVRMAPWSKGAVHFVIGLGTYRVGVHGVATPPAEPTQNGLWTGAVEAGVGVNAFVSRFIAVGFEVDALVTYPYPMIRIGTYDAGRTGRPTILAALSVQLWR
jgi:hypothetical protein